MIVEYVDDDTTTVPVFGVKPLSASAGICAVLGEAVDAAMELHAQGNLCGIIFRDAAFDKVAHQAAELNLRIRSGEVKVDEVVQVLRILL